MGKGFRTCREYNEAMDRVQDEMDRTERTEVLEAKWEELKDKSGFIEYEPVRRE